MGFEVAALALAIGSTAATLYQQDQAAKAHEDYNKDQRENTIKAMNENMSQIELAKQQATEQAGQKQFENNLQAQKAMSTARVSAGEAGVSGLSVDALLSEIDGTRSRYNDSVSANLTDTVDEMNNQRTSAARNARSAVNQLKTPQAPDYIGAALRIGGAAVDYKRG